METGIYEGTEATQIFNSYRQINPNDCFYAETTIGPVIMVFGCPEVVNLDPEAEFSLYTSAAIPVPSTSLVLMLNIDIKGHGPLKMSFSWDTGVPEKLLEAKYLAFFAAKRPKEAWIWLKRRHRINFSDLQKFAKKGSLDVDLEVVRENLKAIITPLNTPEQTLEALKVAGVDPSSRALTGPK